MNIKALVHNLPDTTVASPMPALRSIILDLAVRGKLVPQNPKDEPVSNLLKQIKEEKIKLEKAGKIKPTQSLPPLTNSEKPFPIPAGWEWVKMDAIALLVRGITFSSSMKEIERNKGNIPCFRSGNIQRNLIWDNFVYVPLSIPKKSQIAQKNDILFSIANSYELVGKTSLVDNIPHPVTFGAFLAAIRTTGAIPMYMYHYLNSNYSTKSLRARSSQTTNIANITFTTIKNHIVPLPPLAEQQRIVTKVDALMALCNKLESVLSPDAVPTLRRVILGMAVRGKLVSQNPKDEPASKLLKQIKEEKNKQEKAGKIKPTKPLPSLANSENPFSIPAGWEWTSLHHIGNIFNGNSINAAVKQEKYSAVKNGIPFIATKDVKTGWQKLNYENGISIPKNEPGFRVAHKNAVLICSEGGSAGKKCGFAAKDIYFGNKLIANELYGGIESDFVLSWYQTASFSELFTIQMKGIIGGISANNFKSLSIPLPPLAEQKRIVAKVNALMSLCDQLELALADSRNNRRRLLNSLINTAA